MSLFVPWSSLSWLPEILSKALLPLITKFLAKGLSWIRTATVECVSRAKYFKCISPFGSASNPSKWGLSCAFINEETEAQGGKPGHCQQVHKLGHSSPCASDTKARCLTTKLGAILRHSICFYLGNRIPFRYRKQRDGEGKTKSFESYILWIKKKDLNML